MNNHSLANSPYPFTLKPIKLNPTATTIPGPLTVFGRKQLPKNLRAPRRAKLPPEPVVFRRPVDKYTQVDAPSELPTKDAPIVEENESVWSTNELEAISSLFERKMPQKRATSPPKPRPLPLPLPYKTRTVLTPTPKHHIRVAARSVLATRSTVSDQVRKNPEALIGIARDIGALSPDSDVSEVLDGWTRFLRKGSLSMTIRELGHMGLPDRSLQTFLWAQKHRPNLFPDDRTLASTVEVLARNDKLKMEFELENFLNSASKAVLESMARGFIKAGSLGRARKILLISKKNNRTLDSSVYAKLILEAARNPDGYRLAATLLDELAEREELDLSIQDCTAVMKVCTKLKRFEVVECLFNWFKESGRDLTLVMYTTVLHSRYSEQKYREGLALVWEMEGRNMVMDLPAYRVVIKLCVALNDLERAARYFSRLKEAGFAPTYDIYRDMIRAYGVSRRLAKCKQLCKEVEMAGFTLDREMVSLVSYIEAALKNVESTNHQVLLAAHQCRTFAKARKRASKSSEQAQLKEEIKQLLKEASSLSTPSTFAQAAKLRRVAAAKEKEFLKRKEEINEKNSGSHTMYARSVLVLKVLLYLVLCWSYWSSPVAAVPHHLLQPFGKFLSWKSKDSTGIITVGIIPWLALTSRVSKVMCQKLLKVAIPR